MNSTRNDFIKDCQDLVDLFRYKRVPMLRKYVHDKKGRRKGVVVAIPDTTETGGLYYIGWSMCNLKRDKFIKEIGVANALRRAMRNHPYGEVPKSLMPFVHEMSDRAVRYFKNKKQ
jgi:hypothetical protein